MSDQSSVVSRQPSPPVVYRWADGSFATCSALHDLLLSMLFVIYPSGGGESCADLWLSPSPRRSVTAEDWAKYSDDRRRRLCGLLFDLLGANFARRPKDLFMGPFSVSAGSAGDDGLSIFFPFFVPDEAWERRYEEVRKLWGTPRAKGRLLLWEHAEFFPANHVEVFEEGSIAVGEGKTPEEAVDDLCSTLLVVPESGRESWLAENVERGEWVRPDPDELEVLGVLGEELPFWWESRKLSAWLRERQ